MIVDVLARLTEGVERALKSGYYRDFASTHQADIRAPSLAAAVRRDAPWAFLAEVKPASPSRGDLTKGDPHGTAEARLRLYHDYAVTGISVLTERETFQGSLGLLHDAVHLHPSDGPHARPVLMKDFIIHDDQLDAAQAAGASAVLFLQHLFVRGKTQWELPDAIDAAHRRGLEVLLEVDDGRAFEHAATTKADLIGINNRDLSTLEMNKDRAPDILRHRLHLVTDTPVLALSGIETRADVVAMQEGGATGILVGTTLMEAPHPRAALRRLRGLPHVKCCGTGDPADPDDVTAALGAADAVGCVVRAGGAARERTVDEATNRFAGLPADIERILVTTETDPGWLADAIETTRATGLQLHIEQSIERLRDLRAALGPDTALIALVRLPRASPNQAAGVSSADPTTATRIAGAVRERLTVADRVLLDTSPLADGTEAGGAGIRGDWALARRIIDACRPAPIILAGGLDPDNIEDALRQVRPWGVDVSSGIEGTTKGRKDPDRIRAFCTHARRILNLHDPHHEPDLRVL